jgi:D-alanyl-D-alanine carboxypeptidase
VRGAQRGEHARRRAGPVCSIPAVQGRLTRVAAAIAILAVTIFAVLKLGGGGSGEPGATNPAAAPQTSIIPGSSSAATPEAAADPTSEAGDASEPEEQPRAMAGVEPGASTAATDGAGHIYAANAKRHQLARRLSARSFVAIDGETGEVLLAYREHRRLPIASLTKIMTGLLVAEAGDLKREVTVTPWATRVEPNRDGLIAGHQYSRRLLLYSTLLASNNDAAEALGVDLGGTAAGFYAAMNLRAEELGLTETRYASASGLEDLRNTSTALDQAVLLRSALDNPTFAKVAGTWRIQIPWEPPTGAKVYENHNKMLKSYAGTLAGKTGWTTKAKGCLAVAVERNGHRVIAVVLGADDIWHDMPILVDAALSRAAKQAA